jgi:hypothetical protein
MLFILGALFKYGLETDSAQDASSVGQHRDLLLNSNSLAEFADPRSTALRGATQSKVRVSLVTSFWAEPEDSTTTNPHRREMEAALMANIHNPHFDQVVVFLDGVSEGANCAHFLRGIIEGELGYATMEETDPFSKVACVNSNGGQPTYYEMFQNTLHEAVTGDVVVLANADQAFDDTISLARTLNPEVLAVLGTRGFSIRMPTTIKNFYDSLVGTDYMTDLEQHGNTGWATDLCDSKFSFDTWIFHKINIKNLKEEDFKRLNEKNELVPFYMNEMGAENAALWGVQQSYPFTLYNACDRIHSWHFHLTPKTHHDQKTAWLRGNYHPRDSQFTPRGSVPKPWGGVQGATHPFPPKDPDCVRTNSCFLRQT